ncbi:MAG: glycosyltransferase [Pirellula sp.]|jgi:glycosyltransferase involved in cell wall biosynthesis
MTKPIRKIVMIGQFLFPSGSASAARIRNLALGFVENGCEVSVVPTAPLPKSASQAKPNLPGIRVFSLSKYPGSGFVPQRNSFLRKPFWFISNQLAALRSRSVVASLIHNKNCDLAIFYGRSWSVLSPSLNECRKNGVTSLIDVVELSSQFGGFGGGLSPIYWDWQRMEKKIASHFQGVVTISRGLQDYYQQRGCKHTLVVPSIEGWDGGQSSSIDTETPNEKLRILYVGALLERDSPSSIAKLISGFKANGYLQFDIRIAGKYAETSEGKSVERSWRAQKEVGSSVTFLGRLSDEELAREFSRADFFLLTRKNSMEEACAFPTRLVEYIKAKRPVIVSNVGDIGLYLKDGVNAVFLDEKNPIHTAKRIEHLSRDKIAMTNMITNAYIVGSESFNRRNQCGRIVDFANGFIK